MSSSNSNPNQVVLLTYSVMKGLHGFKTSEPRFEEYQIVLDTNTNTTTLRDVTVTSDHKIQHPKPTLENKRPTKKIKSETEEKSQVPHPTIPNHALSTALSTALAKSSPATANKPPAIQIKTDKEEKFQAPSSPSNSPQTAATRIVPASTAATFLETESETYKEDYQLMLKTIGKLLSAKAQKGDAFFEKNPQKKRITMFDSLKPPAITLEDYLSRFILLEMTPEAFIFGLICADELLKKFGLTIDSLIIHRLLLTGMVVAAKVYDDAFFNNRGFAIVGGIALTELNKLEKEFLKALEYKLPFLQSIKPDGLIAKYKNALIHTIFSAPTQPVPTKDTHKTAETKQLPAPTPIPTRRAAPASRT